MEKDVQGPNADSLSAEKKLAVFDKIFSAYHDARSSIRNDLVCPVYGSLDHAVYLLSFDLISMVYSKI